MHRFYGKMPASEIVEEVYYKDRYGSVFTIQAGPNGWTVLWDKEVRAYDDVVATTEKNLEEALNRAEELYGNLIKV